MGEPLYSLTVHFNNLTEDGVEMLINWINNASETTHLTYWINKADQDEEELEEVTGDDCQ